MQSNNIEEFFKIINQSHGEIELDHINHYTLLIAVVFSARMTDKGVNKATKELFKIVQTPEQMIELGEEKLCSYIKTIGLYKTKAKHAIQLSEILIAKYNSQVPDTLEDLESLPGVGRKTANVMLNAAFNKVAFPVDTHVFRVANRTGLAKGKRPVDIEKLLQKIVPEKYAMEAAHSMVLHGRYVCKSVKPQCETCAVNHLCEKNL